MTAEPVYSTEDMVTAAADLFSSPDELTKQNYVVQLIGTLIGLPQDHFDLLLLLIQKEVTIQYLKSEIARAREEIKELV